MAEVLAEVMVAEVVVDGAKVEESGGATTVAAAAAAAAMEAAAVGAAIAAVEMVPVVAGVVPLAGATGAPQRM